MNKVFILGALLSAFVVSGFFIINEKSTNVAMTAAPLVGHSMDANTVSAEPQSFPENTAVGGTEPGLEKPFIDVSQLNIGAVPLSSKSDYIQWMKKNTPDSELFLDKRWDRVQYIIRFQELSLDRPKVVQAFLRTPREEFCRTQNVPRAYDNAYLSIGYGVTISGPHIVGKMTHEIDPQPEDKILEIGTGSGYQSAILSNLCNHVYTIEIIEALGKETRALYDKLGDKYPQLKNVKTKIADGYYGWAEYAPFDKIIVTAGLDHIPPDLLKQLKPNGIMLIPIGTLTKQTLLKIVKKVGKDGNPTITREDVYQGRIKDNATTFVPFTADGGKTNHFQKQ